MNHPPHKASSKDETRNDMTGLYIGGLAGTCFGALAMQTANTLLQDTENKLSLDVRNCDREWIHKIEVIHKIYQSHNDTYRTRLKREVDGILRIMQTKSHNEGEREGGAVGGGGAAAGIEGGQAEGGGGEAERGGGGYAARAGQQQERDQDGNLVEVGQK